jgi:hypothetical protein
MVVHIIPATQEAEIGGLKFNTSPGEKLGRTYLKYRVGMVAYACNLIYSGCRCGRIMVRGQPGQKYEALTEKYTKAIRASSVAQMVEHFPSKQLGPEFKCQN